MKWLGGFTRDVVGVIGAACIVYGVAQIWLPAAWIVGGGFILCAAIAHALGET